MYGAARPLIVNRLNSIDMVFVTVAPGRMAHSWRMSAKSRSTGGSQAAFGWTMNSPTSPIACCIGTWVW